MHKNLLIIFTRNPDLGKVKTRLASDIGEGNALAVYFKLLHHTREAVASVDADIAVFYDRYIDTEDEWPKHYRKALQEGADLGERMYNALMKGKEWGYKSIGLIGTDAYDLSSEIIDRAFGRIEYHDWVFGPAKDGGYYFVGCHEPQREMFNISAWSTETVLKETLEKAYTLNLSISLVDELNDIDTLEDLKGSPMWSAFEKILANKPNDDSRKNASPVCYLDSEEVREEWRGTGDGGRETEDGRLKTEDGRRETEDGRPETGDGGWKTGDGRRETEDGRLKTGDGGRKTGDGRRETDQ